ncbi:uncharacterized protein A4U43_C01F21800 [Asparagus officinalis]|uniref:Protein BZR1 homolog n=2 Tax=Asparagus officinalis TaxID=4686 RepID=A0A5P1FRZ6_ASPOF|nr:uncharacterized protein A4U43_C01F21800 [Asparagus officinalis]
MERNVTVKRKGCIKLTKGDWVVRRKGKGGVISISRRRPSDREREANRLREQRRRRIANKIYSGLRAQGGFRLPKHPDRNDILIALCEQAGYQVEEDGSVSRKKLNSFEETSENGDKRSLKEASLSYEIEVQPELEEEQLSLDLTLSYKYM